MSETHQTRFGDRFMSEQAIAVNQVGIEGECLSAFPNTRIQPDYGLVVSINAPDFFARKDFVAFIENDNVWSWHKAGKPPSEFSDTCVLFDPCLNGDGPDCHALPDDIQDAILGLLRNRFGERGENLPDYARNRHLAVWLTNIEGL